FLPPLTTFRSPPGERLRSFHPESLPPPIRPRGEPMSGETDIIRILLVEDDPAFASTLHERLSGPEAPAADIVQVGLIVDAVAELTTSPFDLVLLDPGIPDGFGAGAFARIRTAAPDVPVLIL